MGQLHVCIQACACHRQESSFLYLVYGVSLHDALVAAVFINKGNASHEMDWCMQAWVGALVLTTYTSRQAITLTYTNVHV
jgi:hypothetical protein